MPHTPRFLARVLPWSLMLALALVSEARPLRADAKPNAETLIKEGIELRRSGRDADALSKFEQAYRLSKTPRAAAQLGLCLQALARWADADPMLAEALTSTQDAWIRKNRDVIKDALEQVKAHVARVEILGQPQGAKVAVNGRDVGSLPLAKPILVNEGSVDIEVTAEGYRSIVKNLDIRGASAPPLTWDQVSDLNRT